MKKIPHLRRKKRILLEQLQLLEGKKVTEAKCYYRGTCGRMHLVNSEVEDGKYPLMPGNFFTWTYIPDTLLYCIGVGRYCNKKKGGRSTVLWVYHKGGAGMHCILVKELNVRMDEIKIVG